MAEAARPDLTVIVPVYNAAPYLVECLDSILAQTKADFEVIIVDDGSTDGSGKICDQYQIRDNRVTVIHTLNQGTYPARNLALDKAKGKFLFFVDADDFIDPDAFAVLFRAQEESGADFVRARLRMWYDGEVPASYTGGVDFFAPPRKGIVYIDNIDDKPTVCFLGGVTVALISLDLLRRNNLRFRNDVLSGGDAYLCLRIAAVEHKYSFIDREIYTYRRQTVNSLTSTYSPTKTRRMREALGYLDEMIALLGKNNSVERINSALGNSYMNGVIRYLVSCAADSLCTGKPATFSHFKEMFNSAPTRRFLPYYNAGSHAGKSFLLPWLMRLGLPRPAFYLCKLKAKKRYSRELAALMKKET